MVNYAVRISREYGQLCSSIKRISECAKQFAWYEHEADEDISRTHVHGLLMGVSDDIKKPQENWKNWIKAELGVEIKGTDWVFSKTYTVNKVKYDITEESKDKYVTYMSKGTLGVKYTNYDDKYIQERTEQWVKPRYLTNEQIKDSIKNATVKERYTVFQFQNDAIAEVQDICKSVQELDFNTKCELVTRVKQLAFEKKFRVHEKFIYEVCQAITAFYFPDYFASRVASRF